MKIIGNAIYCIMYLLISFLLNEYLADKRMLKSVITIHFPIPFWNFFQFYLIHFETFLALFIKIYLFSELTPVATYVTFFLFYVHLVLSIVIFRAKTMNIIMAFYSLTIVYTFKTRFYM